MPHGLPLGRHAPSKLRLADVQRDLHQCGRRQRQTENRAVSSQPECVRMPHLCLPRRALLLPSSARGKPSTPCPQAWLPASRPTRSPATQRIPVPPDGGARPGYTFFLQRSCRACDQQSAPKSAFLWTSSPWELATARAPTVIQVAGVRRRAPPQATCCQSHRTNDPGLPLACLTLEPRNSSTRGQGRLAGLTPKVAAQLGAGGR